MPGCSKSHATKGEDLGDKVTLVTLALERGWQEETEEPRQEELKKHLEDQPGPGMEVAGRVLSKPHRNPLKPKKSFKETPISAESGC